MSQVTTHVLNTASGRPAAGIYVRLEGNGVAAEGVTDADGRISELGPESLEPGVYRLVFETGGFWVEITIAFTVSDQSHYHVPLLLSPFAYSTYRGS